MATQHHYEALRKQRVIDRAKKAREKTSEQELEERNRNEEETKSSSSSSRLPEKSSHHERELSGKRKETELKKTTKDKATQTASKET